VFMNGSGQEKHPYAGSNVVLATKHAKEQALARPLRASVGIEVIVPEHLDTDQLGTFTGEIERNGTPREVALRKARMGMEISRLPRGLANEGSFGMHPAMPFIPSDHELLLFVDDEIGIQIVEQILSEQTNFDAIVARSIHDLQHFLQRVDFPSHAVIVRPEVDLMPDLLFKGITSLDALRVALERCASASPDGLAHVETDMRAHVNPTRMRVIRRLAFKMARRLACLCKACNAPGWGTIDVVRGLPCEWCGNPTDLVREEVMGCAHCDYQERRPRKDGMQIAPAGQCAICNP